MQNPLAPLRVVSLAALDPALEQDKAALKEYFLSRDPAALKFVEGRTPAWFTVLRLPAAWLFNVLDKVSPGAPDRPTPADRLCAFRAAVHQVETAEGEVLRCAPPGEQGARWTLAPVDYGVSMAPEAWAQEIADRYGASAVLELGQVAIDHARLARGARGPFGYWGGSVASL